jgi:hypothetical protein
VDDYILQLRASTILPVYKKTSGGHVRSYVTTPAKCPASGHWQSPIRIWWGNGKVDTVMTQQPCVAPRRAGGPAS